MKKPEIKKNRKLRNVEVMELYHALKGVKGLQGIKLVYAVNRTVNWLKPIVEAFAQEELIPMPEDINKYQKELREFYERIAKAEDGSRKLKTIINNDGMPVELLDIDFNNPFNINGKAEIDKKYDKAIKDYQTEIEKYNLFLDKECEEEIRLYSIPLAYAPDNKEQFDIVAPLIKDMTAAQQARWDELFAEISSE
jgi:hypothetical protein